MKRFLILTLFCGSAHAEFWDGNRLFEKLTSSSYYEQGLGMGYVMGVTDTTMDVLHCAPSNATAGQVQDMVVAHLRRFPERRTRTADAIIVEALKAAWPCANNRGGRQL